MGEVEVAKNEGEKKDAAPTADAGAKKDDGNDIIVLKMDMHCEGCAKKIRRAIRNFEGVEDVKADSSNNKLTVTGKVDPAKVKARLEEKTRKKAAKDLVAVTGTMDVKELAPYLKQKLKRGIEVVPPPAKKDGGGADKKEGKESGGGNKKEGKESGGGDKKDGKEAPAAAEKKEGGDGGKTDGGDGGKKEENSKEVKAEKSGEQKLEMSKFEHHGSYHSQPSYWYDQGQPSYYSHSYAVEPYGYHGGYAGPPAPVYAHPVHEGYSHYPQYPVDPRLQAPQMFSDENPNACSVM
ncbi:hypothetical protein CRG98_014431 [Punica granatum]|uniref:HMA domain-containing protein n=1 Tax=Punica granatum TaxID=22663 RepID=A0A2I0K990_PUNGR|nr:hypothetical protein CRG98_014431 [Punica granatum]